MNVTTQIMTRVGWKSYQDLTIGEDVLTLNTETMLSEWQPLTRAGVTLERTWHVRRLESRSHKSLTLPSQKWPVLERKGREKIETFVWRTSGDLTTESKIIKAAPHSQFPLSSPYSDSFVEFVAWYWNDGWETVRDRPGLTGGMGASKQRKVVRMRAVLERSVERNGGSNGGWSETHTTGDRTMFRWGTPTQQLLNQIAPSKVPSYSFILSLTEPQLSLFVETCVDGDGSRSENGQRMWRQTDKHGDAISVFELACVLLGQSTSTNPGTEDENRYGRTPDNVELTRRTYSKPVLSNQRRSAEGDAIDAWEDYTGAMWSPSTSNGTWLAREDGSVFYTGTLV